MPEAPESMLDVLRADGPAPEYAAQMMLYGRFVGEWDGTVVVHRSDGTRREETCEVYFGWVLGGRAVQDVWIAPARRDRADPATLGPKDIYGTTIRVYEPLTDSWRITWIEPNTSTFEHLTGRQDGEDIVQEYRDPDGARWEWRFTGITPQSFHWLARESRDDGRSWQVRNEFFLKRRASAP